MAQDISQTLFDTTVQTLTASVRLCDPKLDTNNGSVIYLLLLRPLGYLAAKLTSLFASYLRKSSLQTLSTSLATDTLLLDLIASNFMLQRRTLEYATGYITLILSLPTAYIPAGMSFRIALHTFSTSARIYIAPSNYSGALTALSVVRVSSYPMSGNMYSAAIPVTCTVAGKVLIGSGATVLITWSMPLVIAVLLLSPISSGLGALTDALLVRRIQDTVVMLSHTTARVLNKRLEQAPYPVLSCTAVGGTQLPRASHNYIGVARGGMVDVFIKTQNQPTVTQRLVLCTSLGTLLFDAAGVISVLSVRNLSGTVLDDITLRYTTALEFLTDDLARLSSVQVVLVHSESIEAGRYYTVLLRQMPGVREAQTYILQPDVAFIGESILIRSAVPVTLDIKIGLDSLTDIDDATLARMRLAIADIVNSAAVGQAVLNISDIDKMFGSRFSGSTLRAPCSIAAHIPTKLGGDYTFTSLACVIDITLRLGLYTWDVAAYYYCTTPANIELIRV